MDQTFFRVLEWIGSFVLGSLISFIAFKTRIALMERRLDAQEAELKAHRQHTKADAERMENSLRNSIETLRVDMDERHEENKGRQRMMERRQMFTLKLVADVARKIGIDNRVDDVVIAFLTKDNEDDSGA